ncbi:MAG: marine proteobacterial sortase target protein [Lysobacteraceae bacterium]
MSTHRITEKPRLPRTPYPRLPVPAPERPGKTAPTVPSNGSDSRHGGLGRRHWFSIFALWLALCGSALADPRCADCGLSLRAGADWLPLLALDTTVTMDIRGPVAEVLVRQQYVNDSADWREGRYLLPLPPDAAVGHLRLRIGERLIEGEVQEKETARQIYSQAAAQGRSAALVEQQRPNLFRTALANIGPGERIEVEIGYWQLVGHRDGRFHLDLPLTLTPRYRSMQTPTSDEQADAELPAVAAATGIALEPSVALDIRLDAGVPLARIDSPTHAIKVSAGPDGHRIALDRLAELADRDFSLQWTPQPSAVPQRAVFVEEVDGEHFALLTLLPPSQNAAALPRELILVIDTSGSMQGVAIQQAVAALDDALNRLRAEDHFNLIRFDSRSEQLFPESVPAQANHIARARRYLAGLVANGGTEMAPALELAFAGAPPPGMVRQVVLATDAAIHDEAGLFTLIEQQRGAARLFPVGIGSAPNAHFLRKAAELGRGSQAMVRDIHGVAEAIRGLFERLDRPMLHDIDIHWPNAAEVYPPRIPDLYAGEPLRVVARLAAPQGMLSVSGQTRERPWQSSLKLETLRPAAAKGLGKLWARARIEAIEDAVRAGLTETEARPLIVETALRHGLTSRYTSLIAVERTPRRPLDAALAATDIPNAAPAGGDALMMAQGSTPARSRLGMALGLALLVIALLRREENQSVRRPVDADDTEVTQP